MAAALTADETPLLAEARKARQEMEYLLQAVAHELRSPLAVASGYVRMLRDGTIEGAPSPTAYPLDIVEEKLAECRGLVDDLLVAARRDASHAPARATVDLETVAQRAVERAWPRAALIGARVTADTPVDPAPAYGDAGDIERIVSNLIANALEHGGERPQVVVSVGRNPGPFISVSDRGGGVRPHDRQRVFERFVRGASSGGAGLGLHLSRELAEASGGSLTLDDFYEGPGARFVLRLPEPPDAHEPARNGSR